MSLYTPSPAPPLLRLPPLPIPPRAALALLDTALLPASLAPPARAYPLDSANHSDDEFPAGLLRVEAVRRPRRTAAGRLARDVRGMGDDFPPDDEEGGDDAEAMFRAQVGAGRNGGVRSEKSAQHLLDAGEEADEWEDEENTGAEEPVGELVILGRHPALVRNAVGHHVGVLVAYRRGLIKGEQDVKLERMPLATRVGMRLLYHGLDGGRLVNSKRTERVFQRWSIREGKKFDDPAHAYERICAFVKAYNIDCSQLREPDLHRYRTMNKFFARKLARGARPPASPGDPTVVSSAADCRLTVFASVADAKRLWIKGKHFTLHALLQDPSLAAQLKNGAVAIFRLAVEDYHRFHSPVDAVVGESNSVPGAYFTVNSMIVRDKRFDVFTENKRDVTTLLIRHPLTGTPLPVAYVQVGALLVASIRRTARQGASLKRGDELGYFAYGGSTIVCVFPPGCVEWDEDLVRNSEGRNVEGVQVETLVKVGEKIGRWVDPSHEA